MKELIDARNEADKIDLGKIFNELPDGTTVILPSGKFYLAGECYMKPHQVLMGQEGDRDSILIGG